MPQRLIQSPRNALLVSLSSASPLTAWGLIAGHHSPLGWIDLLLATILGCYVLTERLPDNPDRRIVLLRRAVLAAVGMASVVIITALPGIEWDRACWAVAAGMAGAFAALRLGARS